MGTTPSVTFNLSQYHFIDSIVDPLTGDGKLYQNNETGETVCVIEKLIQEQRKLSQRYEHPNLLKVYHYQIETIQELCSTFTKLMIVYEYTNLCIISNVKHRIKKQMPFTQNQLWGLLQQFLDVLNYLKDYGVHPMDFKNAMISNQGRIKLHSLQQVSNYQQLLHNCTDEVHLSPEELQCLKNRQYSLNLDFEKCQIFQLGLLSLYCASLQETNNVFDMNQYTYSQNEIKIRIQQLNYSEQYKNLLFQMLQHSPDQRGTLYSLLNQVKHYPGDNNLLQLKKDTSIHEVYSIQSNAPEPLLFNNLRQSNVPKTNKLLHILTPEQSRISKQQELEVKRSQFQNRSEQNIQQESKPTLNTQQDENFEIDFTNRQNQLYYSSLSGNQQNQFPQEQEIKMPTLNQNINPIKRLQERLKQTQNRQQYQIPNTQPVIQQPKHVPPILQQYNRQEYYPFVKQSMMSQASNKSEIENKVEQALRSSKMALKKFDQTIDSAQKTRQLY